MSATQILSFAAWAMLIAGLLAAAASDLRRRLVPDTAVLAVAFGGLLLRFLSGGIASVGASLAAALALFVGLSLLWRLGALGGGDAKLIAAAALGETVAGLLALLAGIALAGGVLAGFWLLGAWLFADPARAARRNGRGAGRFLPPFGGAALARNPIPYAPAVLIGWAWSRIW